MKACKNSGGIALLILNPSARRRSVVSFMTRPIYSRLKSPSVFIAKEAVWAPEPVRNILYTLLHCLVWTLQKRGNKRYGKCQGLHRKLLARLLNPTLLKINKNVIVTFSKMNNAPTFLRKKIRKFIALTFLHLGSHYAYLVRQTGSG